MEIARIDVHQVDLPYAGGTYRLSGGRTYTGVDATTLRIETDDNCQGWGDAVECLAWTRRMRQWTDPPAPSVQPQSCRGLSVLGLGIACRHTLANGVARVTLVDTPAQAIDCNAKIPHAGIPHKLRHHGRNRQCPGDESCNYRQHDTGAAVAGLGCSTTQP